MTHVHFELAVPQSKRIFSVLTDDVFSLATLEHPSILDRSILLHYPDDAASDMRLAPGRISLAKLSPGRYEICSIGRPSLKHASVTLRSLSIMMKHSNQALSFCREPIGMRLIVVFGSLHPSLTFKSRHETLSSSIIDYLCIPKCIVTEQSSI